MFANQLCDNVDSDDDLEIQDCPARGRLWVCREKYLVDQIRETAEGELRSVLRLRLIAMCHLFLIRLLLIYWRFLSSSVVQSPPKGLWSLC